MSGSPFSFTSIPGNQFVSFGFLLLIFILLPLYGSSQQFDEVTYIKDVSRDVLSGELRVTVSNGVRFYKMTYHTTGSDGLPDIASGLIVIPDDQQENYPLLVYHHGTSTAKDLVPSSLNLDYEAYAYMGGMGYLVIAPDYLGMGESRGFHPYVHRHTQASASIDMVRAFRQWVQQSAYSVNDNLFLTGYSQGGHASMSTHRAMEEYYNSEFSITAAVHMAGPYSLSGVMRDIILGNQGYEFPGFIPFAVLGFQEVYGDLYDDLSEVFRAPVIRSVEDFYNGRINLTQLSISLILFSAQQFGNLRPVNMLNSDFVGIMRSGTDNRFDEVLKDSDTYNWRPAVPTRLFYCGADELVPAANSLVALESMLANGADNVRARDINPFLGHGPCAAPSIAAAVEFFNSFDPQRFGIPDPLVRIRVYPNPATGNIFISGLDELTEVRVRVFDTAGREILNKIYNGRIDLTGINQGVYFIRIEAGEVMLREKVFIY